MFILLFLSCYWVVTLAQVPVSFHETGFSDQYKSANTLGEYTFGYNEDHTTGGSFRRETSDRFGNKLGSYGLRIGDGRVRIVNYVADQNGFRADVFSNEPGIESQDINRFSKISKDKMSTVLVPGFKYFPASPYVTVENNRHSSTIRHELVDESDKFNEEDDFEGEDFANVYAGEDNQEGSIENIFPNEGFGDDYSKGQLDSNNFYMNQEEDLDGPFLNGEYSHEFESAVNNQSLEQTATDTSAEVQKMHINYASTSDSVTKNDSARNEEMSYEKNKYNTESANAFVDLQPFQSTIVLSKEPVTSHDIKNTTLHEADSSSRKNVTSNTKPEMDISV